MATSLQHAVLSGACRAAGDMIKLLAIAISQSQVTRGTFLQIIHKSNHRQSMQVLTESIRLSHLSIQPAVTVFVKLRGIKIVELRHNAITIHIKRWVRDGFLAPAML